MKTLSTASIVTMIGVAALVAASYSYAKERTTGRGTGPTIYATSQGLFYDSLALTDLPLQGDFQQLIPGENGLATDYGPGQPGHLGGRWWIDTNGDGVMDEPTGEEESDVYFLCPLLGPGRETFN